MADNFNILDTNSGGGGQQTQAIIDTIILESPTKFVDFSDIPQDFTDLFILGVVQSAHEATNDDPLDVRFNASGEQIYRSTRIIAAGGSIATATNLRTGIEIGPVAGQSITDAPNQWTSLSLYILAYAETKFHNWHSVSAYRTQQQLTSGVCEDDTPITSVRIGLIAADQNMVVGSRFSLYGLKTS